MRCSMTCAAQPLVREITNSGVKCSVGTPILLYETALNQSRLANIFFSLHITASMRHAPKAGGNEGTFQAPGGAEYTFQADDNTDKT